MHYISTRGHGPVSFSEAVAMGLAPDGGLYLPSHLPDIRPHLARWASLDYVELCEEFLALFSDLPRYVLSEIVRDAYSRFDHPDIAPLVKLDERTFVLELFHGPTLAFKDFALQLLGNLYEEQIKRTGRPINVLGATSGDTGAAAIHGLLGRQRVNIFILYPDGRVSPLQERQMACTGAENVYALAIDGSFDDAQCALKETFEDLSFKQRMGLSAINSINLARVLAQCVYYVYGWFRLPPELRDNVEFVVPTGNFGNVLAGWWAQKMGLPVRSFRVATNQNDILYAASSRAAAIELGGVRPSHAPSMDIQVASNFERFVYFAEGRDPARVRHVMSEFKRTGRYVFSGFNPDSFTASRATDIDIVRLIREVDERFGYVCDPHTACGFADLDPARVSVVLATAHPAKFPRSSRTPSAASPGTPRSKPSRTAAW
jgi:threonine synthase